MRSVRARAASKATRSCRRCTLLGSTLPCCKHTLPWAQRRTCMPTSMTFTSRVGLRAGHIFEAFGEAPWQRANVRVG